jgi:hypothetical protein
MYRILHRQSIDNPGTDTFSDKMSVDVTGRSERGYLETVEPQSKQDYPAIKILWHF